MDKLADAVAQKLVYYGTATIEDEVENSVTNKVIVVTLSDATGF